MGNLAVDRTALSQGFERLPSGREIAMKGRPSATSIASHKEL
jgi:hypothetical protein